MGNWDKDANYGNFHPRFLTESGFYLGIVTDFSTIFTFGQYHYAPNSPLMHHETYFEGGGDNILNFLVPSIFSPIDSTPHSTSFTGRCLFPIDLENFYYAWLNTNGYNDPQPFYSIPVRSPGVTTGMCSLFLQVRGFYYWLGAAPLVRCGSPPVLEKASRDALSGKCPLKRAKC